MKMTGKRMCLALCIAGLGILGTAAGVIYAQAAGAFGAGDITLQIAGTDKARYAPGETVRVEAAVENATDRRLRRGTLEMKVYHLEEEIYYSQQELALDKGEKKTLSLEWQPPETDFQGYVISLEIRDREEKQLALDTIGADVSSSWVKFPRYGYVCSYSEEEEAAPLPLSGLRVKYYTPEDITGIWLASPDEESAVSTSLAFEEGEDDRGRYLEFEVPSLQYWDLLYMKKQEND